MTTESASAEACKRAATFTVSPRTVTAASVPPWTLPTTAIPVLRPIRNCGRSPCLTSRSAPEAFSFCNIDRAARHARSGASSPPIGAPKTAMMPSPVKPCTTPPCSRTASSISFAKRRMSVKAASSPDRSEKVVKPTMSVNRTVICLRSASMQPSATLANESTAVLLSLRPVDGPKRPLRAQLLARSAGLRRKINNFGSADAMSNPSQPPARRKDWSGGTERLLEVGQSMSALPVYFRHQLVPLSPKKLSTSIPRYLTVLSILVWPSRSWTALRLRVRRLPPAFLHDQDRNWTPNFPAVPARARGPALLPKAQTTLSKMGRS
jgi:hypothetical protein